MKFNELNLKDFILKNIDKIGFSETTEIQSLCIPQIVLGADVVGLSQTGSGKTLAYGIPAVSKIDSELNKVQVLIICPTRELTTQVCDELKKLTLDTQIKVVPVYGGSDITRQIVALKKADIVVGTPGRLMDHLNRRTLKLADIKMVVLDEADEMLKMGFKEDVESILKTTPKIKQMIMFSATMPKEILNITKNFMDSPVTISSTKSNAAQDFIDQYYIQVEKTQKKQAIVKLIKDSNFNTALIFCNTKRMVDELEKTLADNSIKAVGMHGDKRQSERKRILDGIKKNGQGILIGTDVIARGIDINNVDAVINYDLPEKFEYYIHRIGRTARAGKSGKSFTIINTKNQANAIYELAKETKNTINKFDLKLNNYEISEHNKSSKNDNFKSHTKDNNFKSKENNNKTRNEKSSNNKTRNENVTDFYSTKKYGNRKVLTETNRKQNFNDDKFSSGKNNSYLSKDKKHDESNYSSDKKSYNSFDKRKKSENSNYRKNNTEINSFNTDFKNKKSRFENNKKQYEKSDSEAYSKSFKKEINSKRSKTDFKNSNKSYDGMKKNFDKPKSDNVKSFDGSKRFNKKYENSKSSSISFVGENKPKRNFNKSTNNNYKNNKSDIKHETRVVDKNSTNKRNHNKNGGDKINYSDQEFYGGFSTRPKKTKSVSGYKKFFK